VQLECSHSGSFVAVGCILPLNKNLFSATFLTDNRHGGFFSLR
jgi:hypothetical protein